MNTQNNEVYDLYKPFANQLKNLNWLESLYVIWAYARNYTFNLSIPNDIQTRLDFNYSEPLMHRRMKGIIEFEQEFLAKEIILNSNEERGRYSLKNYDTQAKLINYLRHTLNNEIDKKYSIPAGILLEFNRIAHRQFKWQVEFSDRSIIRYYKIYSIQGLDDIIARKFGLNCHELFMIGMFLFRFTAENFLIKLPLGLNDSTRLITSDKVDIFLSHFSMTRDEAKSDIKQYQCMNGNLFYSYNPLLAKPILKHGAGFFCPIPMLLFWQVTRGVYYSVLNEKGFAKAFGDSFQNYIGEVLSRCCTKVSFLPEIKYAKGGKLSSDWIVWDKSAILFVECKTKRLTLLAKSNLDPSIEKGLTDELGKMASFITQLYKTYIDYTKNEYVGMSYDSEKFFIPMVVTLEDWYLNFNYRIKDILDSILIDKFKEENIDVLLLSKFPYYLMSCEEFERAIQLINDIGIKEYYEMLKSNSLVKFEYKSVFDKEFEKIFINSLKD